MPAALPPKTPLGRLIRNARESIITDFTADGGHGGKHKMTQIELADAIGAKQQSIARWEAGIVMPPYGRLPALAAALNLDVTELVAAAAESSDMPAETPAVQNRIEQVENDVEEIKGMLGAIAEHLGLSQPAADQSSQPAPIRSAGRRRQAPVRALRSKSR